MNERTIFMAALDFSDPKERSAYVDQACGGDSQLRDRVVALLGSHEGASGFLQVDAPPIAPTLDVAPIAEKPGMKIGRYKLVHEIGQGGMGVVYMAVQKDPVKRKVALKIIKPGMDTRDVVTRFEAERQALALMDHQCIATVLDGGSTDSGRPYFVMELVEGTPITEYADAARHTTRQRLELFIQVCQAVQHAHQKGVIHRDIKPSNILVTNYDDKAVPKVIDFGIAKAVHQPLTDGSLYTHISQMIGTPLYMSPEQAQRTGHDVDTRTDVYSLGVLLYELLTGTTPFDKERLESSGLDEFKRIIREEEPPRPSTRLSTVDAALETVADKHRTDIRTLTKELSGELDWIVMKALEKDRTRRYETADAFAKDIQRYLSDEPVEACPPSKAYRFRKFAQRNKAALTSVAAVLVSVLILLVSTTWVALGQREVALSQQELMQRRLAVQEGINSALTEVARLRGQPQATATGDALFQAREQLQRALALAESGPADAYLVAQVQNLSDELDQEQRDRKFLAALDEAWLSLGNMHTGAFAFDPIGSISNLRDAFEAYGLPVGKGSPEEAAATIRTRPEAVRQELIAALDEWHELVKGIGIAVLVGDSGVFINEAMLVGAVERDGRLKNGDRLIGVGVGRDGSIVDIRTVMTPELRTLLRGEPATITRLKVIPKGTTEARIYEIEPDPTTAWLKSVVAAADSDPWRRRVRETFDLTDEAEQRAALLKLVDEVDIERQPVPMLRRLAVMLSKVEAVDGAISLLRKVRQRHPSDFCANLHLANMLRTKNTPHLEEAVRYYTAAVALRPHSALLHNNLGVTLEAQGKLDEAIAEFRDAIRLKPDVAEFHVNLGHRIKKPETLEEAIAEFREAIRLKPDFAPAHFHLGIALQMQGELDEAIAEYREEIRLDPDRARAHNNLGAVLRAQGKIEEAIAEFREEIRLNPDSAEAHGNLGSVLQVQGKIEEAIVEYRESVRLNPDFAMVHGNLGVILGAQGKLEEAIAEYREAIRLKPDYAAAHNNLAWLLATSSDPKWRQPAQAVELAKKAVSLAPGFGGYWNTLGVAQYRAGDFKGAIESANKSLALESTGCGIDWFFLAMAHGELGRKEEARSWYDKAVEWMEKHSPEDEQLLRYRAEAVQVLEIPEEPSTAKEPPDKTE